MKMLSSRFKLIVSGLCCVMASGPVAANPDVTTREYKLLLNPALFTYTTESSQVNSYFSAFTNAVDTNIAREVTAGPAQLATWSRFRSSIRNSHQIVHHAIQTAVDVQGVDSAGDFFQYFQFF